ncbi:MAG: ATP-dependent Clp protease adapter ClpS [Verrucomicrobia bacterium]|nr:ATP-dependent Clp protease adapter ClpS [Verrucomicrobiota bacterium]MBI3867868.1 ATP-dependent Clp protease adapter ClpS [Verrucomicrobiota bacterium]
MSDIETPVLPPQTDEQTATKPKDSRAPAYVVIVWNDPINLMPFVTRVFRRVFGWDQKKAEHHMLEVHRQGKSVVAKESLEKAESYVHQLQSFSLHATMEPEQ